MAIQYGENRQEAKTLAVKVDFSDLASGTFVPLFTLPNGAWVISGALHVVTASDAATSETLSLGTSGAATSLLNAVNAKSAARTAVTLVNAPYTGKTVIGVTRTAVGATTVGSYIFTLTYGTLGASSSTQN